MKTSKPVFPVAVVLAPGLPNRQFGNLAQLSGGFFCDSAFVEFHRALDYIAVNKHSRNDGVPRFFEAGKSYVSGWWSMANICMRFLDVLDIDPGNVQLGQPFCHGLAAFIVGSGMHGDAHFHEVFDLHSKLLPDGGQAKPA